jgi:hypothetical protein
MPTRKPDSAREAYNRALAHRLADKSKYPTPLDVASELVREAKLDGLDGTIIFGPTTGLVESVRFSTGEAANYDATRDSWD